MTLVTPLSFNYSQLPPAIPARKKTRKFSPENGAVFTPNGVNVIRIPVRDLQYLDGKNSYLKFNFKQNGGDGTTPNSLSFDPNCSAVIRRVRILVGSTVAEDIERVNVLQNLLVQSQGSDDYNRALGILSGQSVDDEDGTDRIHGEVLAHGVEKTYCTSVFSGFLNCGKYIPLGLMGSNSLTIELYLERAVNIGVWTSAPQGSGYELSSVEFVGSMIEIQGDAVNNALQKQMMESGLEFHGTTYSTHTNSVSGSAAQLNIPERCKSLKGLMSGVVYGLDAHDSASLQTRFPGNITGGGIAWNYRIGSELLPQQPVTNSAESFIEFQKCYNHLFSLDQSCYANKLRWNTTADVADKKKSGCFNMTISTESFSHTNSMESGLDLASSSIPVSLSIGSMVLESNKTETILTYAYKDVIWRLGSSGFEVSL